MTKEQHSTQTSLTDEQIVNLGQQAAMALNNPILQIIYDKLCRDYYLQWAKLPAEYTKEAASLKAKHLALNEIFGNLTSLVQHAEKVYAEMQERNDPQRKRAEKLDTQGYGLDFRGER